MKASDAPELSKKWWIAQKPAEIKGADLEKALQAAEKALADEKKKSDPLTLDSCLAALKAVGAAAQKTVSKECDKKKHKDVIIVLSKFDPLIKSETGRLEELKQKEGKCAKNSDDEEDDEPGDDKLFDRGYLHDMIKLLRSTGKELRFGLGLDTKSPENSKLLLARKGKPEKLFKALKKTGEFNKRLMTCGYALPDREDSATLVFRLEEGEGEPPQIVKLGRQFLRSDKNLKFRKVKLVLPGGKIFEDTEPDAEVDSQAVRTAEGARSNVSSAGQRSRRDRLKKQARLLTARQAWIQARDEARKNMGQVKAALRKAYRRDATQLPLVMQKAKLLDAVFVDLSDELRQSLDKYLKASATSGQEIERPKLEAVLRTFTNRVTSDRLLAAIDEDDDLVPQLKIKAPLLDALRRLEQAVSS